LKAAATPDKLPLPLLLVVAAAPAAAAAKHRRVMSRQLSCCRFVVCASVCFCGTPLHVPGVRRLRAVGEQCSEGGRHAGQYEFVAVHLRDGCGAGGGWRAPLVGQRHVTVARRAHRLVMDARRCVYVCVCTNGSERERQHILVVVRTDGRACRANSGHLSIGRSNKCSISASYGIICSYNIICCNMHVRTREHASQLARWSWRRYRIVRTNATPRALPSVHAHWVARTAVVAAAGWQWSRWYYSWWWWPRRRRW
jgi:hypothetical protein